MEDLSRLAKYVLLVYLIVESCVYWIKSNMFMHS
jgi:hypothetical protein